MTMTTTTHATQNDQTSRKVFVPHSEALQNNAGVLGELVPFKLEYECVRLLDGTYAFVPV